jgi:serine/threonine protein kinase
VKDEHGNRYAMKIMKPSKKCTETDGTDLFTNEVSALKDLHHPNILKIYDYKSKAEALRPDGSKLRLAYITLENAEGGELFNYIAETGRFSEDIARYIFKQIIDALDYVHNQGYNHRDIKPENILLDKDFNIKLADFGFATKEAISHTRKGTYGYMAPEVLASEPYKGEEADLFAASVILFVMVTQHPPFLRADKSDRFYKPIIDGKLKKFWEIHSDIDLSEEFIDFFTRMASFDPKDRMTISQIKAHEWYNGPVASHKDTLIEFTKRQKLISKKIKGKENKNLDNDVKTNQEKKKALSRYTKFYKITDADFMIDTVVECAKLNDVRYSKSKEFFRAEIKYTELTDEIHAFVNVLKKPESEMRCLEFIRISGNKDIFNSLFVKFRAYCAKVFK